MGDGGNAIKPGATSSQSAVAPATSTVGKHTLTAQLGASSSAGSSSEGRAASEALGVARSLVPAYQRAVNALDGMAVLELARNIVGALQLAEAGKQQVAAGSERNVVGQRLTAELAAFESQLAIQLGPQQLDGVPVMGTVVPSQLGGDPVAYVINESSLVVELLGVVAQVMRVTGAQIGLCPPPSPGAVQVVIHLVEPWRSRPINFAFLVAALRKLHVWDEVSTVKSNVHGKTLADAQQKVAAQAQETGALADVGDLDTEHLGALLHESPPGTKGARPGGQFIDDRIAQKLLERLAAAAPTARGPLVLQIARMGKLGRVCDHLPKQAVQSLHDAIAPFDPPTAAMLRPFFDGKPGGGRSMHKVYEDKIMDNLHDGNPVRGYLWTLLDTAHNALTMGFEHEYSQAYDAHEAGLTTDAGFHSAGGKALGKAAAIGLVSAATGGIAGGLGEGFAAGLGAGRSVASLIGAGVGGFGAGVGGHLAGDVFDQTLNGKQGFDSFGAYMKSGAEGGLMGTVLGGISVGAGKYLGKGGGLARPVDQLAARYPQNAGVLERLRAAGFGAGAQTRAAAIKIKVTAAELADMIASGLVAPQPTFAPALANLPPGGQLELSARPQPMQMSAQDPPGGPGTSLLPGSRGGGHKPDASPDPKLHIDEIKPAESKTKPEVERSDMAEPRSGDLQPDEVEHFEKGHFADKGKLAGGGHGHSNIAELQRRGYEELPPAEVAKLRKNEQAYEKARIEYGQQLSTHNAWTNAQRRFSTTLPEHAELRKLKNPTLSEAEKIRLKPLQAKHDAALEEWGKSNPEPVKPSMKPSPKDFGLDRKYQTLGNRMYYYREPLGNTGAQTGGVSSTNPIHVDGHTWFPPGWEAEPLMKLLETNSPAIVETPKTAKGILSATERSAWIKKGADGIYSIAPAELPDPETAGYLKTKMITPADGGKRTVFPEMHQ